MQPAWMADLHNPVRRFTLAFALIYVFLRFSLLPEIAAVTMGIRTYLPFIFGIPTLVGVLISGGMARTFRFRAAWYWIGFALWMVACIPFSSWKSGSIEHASNYFRYELPMLFVMAGLALTWAEVRRFFYAICAAGLVNVTTGRLLGDMDSGRLEVGLSSIGNANDFAAHILIVLPFLWFMFGNDRVPRILRLGLIPPMAYSLYLILSTASRGALLSLAVLTVFALYRATGTQRLMFAVGSLVAGTLLFAILPGPVVNRFRTLFNDDESGEAVASMTTRSYLLKQSIRFTLENPLFGVGPGEFENFEGGSAKEAGRRGAWQVSHNSYTQVSSEAGIPALLFFVAAIVASYRALSRALAGARAARLVLLERAAFAMMLSLIGFAVSIMFLSMAYRYYMPALSGLALAFAAAAEREVAAARAAAPIPAVASPLPGRGKGVWQPPRIR